MNANSLKIQNKQIDGNEYLYALAPDGVNDYGESAGNITSEAADFTMELWLKGAIGGSSDLHDGIFCAGGYTLEWQKFYGILTWRTPTNAGLIDLDVPNAAIPWQAGVGYFPNWTHIVCRYTQATKLKEVIFNTVLKASQVLANSARSSFGISQKVRIGADYAASPRYFSGKIDEARFYNRALTDVEILANYTNAVNRIPYNSDQLAARYKFEQTAKNSGSGGSSLDLTLYNFTGSPYVAI